jgi:hypothetical protein
MKPGQRVGLPVTEEFGAAGGKGLPYAVRDAHAVREAGFDHVRVPMRVSAHAARQPPYKIGNAALDLRGGWSAGGHPKMQPVEATQTPPVQEAPSTHLMLPSQASPRFFQGTQTPAASQAVPRTQSEER